jgi:hypothetical protein
MRPPNPLTMKDLEKAHDALISAAGYNTDVMFHPDAIRDVCAALHRMVANEPDEWLRRRTDSVIDRLSDNQLMELFISVLFDDE